MIFRKLMGLVADPETAFGQADVTTGAMRAAIAQWYDLYYRSAAGRDACYAQRIPYTVVDALYRACFGEYRFDVVAADGAGDGGAKGALVRGALEALDRVRAAAFQHALIGGEVFLKPLPLPAGGFAFTVTPRIGYAVLGRDAAGEITAVGSREVTREKGRIYTLLEKRFVGAGGCLTIESKLYESRAEGTLGRRVALEKLEKYAGMREVLTLPRPCGLGMVHMRTPMANCVDQSWDGVSVFAAAAGKILACARHEQRIEDEYRLTRPHVIASVDIQRRDENGELMALPEYITPLVDDDVASAGLTVYNPKPNQAELEARSQQHLRDIENIIGLRRGMLANVEREERTATEVQASSTRYAMTIAEFCGMWKQAVARAAALCDVLGQMYHGWDAGPYGAVEVSFGDGVLYDTDKEFERIFRTVKEGWLAPEVLVKWLGERGL